MAGQALDPENPVWLIQTSAPGVEKPRAKGGVLKSIVGKTLTLNKEPL